MTRRNQSRSYHVLSSLTRFGRRPTGWLIVALCLIATGAAIIFPGGVWRAVAAQAQKERLSADGLWQEVEVNSLSQSLTQRQIVPKSHRTLRLNRDALRQLLNQAPMEFTAAAASSQVVMTLPLPEGTFGRFRVVESPIMEPALAAQFPDIKTYSGQDMDDPTVTVRFDVTPEGFHAMIFSSSGTIYVDPFAKGDTDHYITYHKQDAPREDAFLQCFVSSTEPSLRTPGPIAQIVVSGGTLHTYRLALAAAAEYTAVFRQPGDTDAQARARALAAMTTTMNRVNGIFEREVGVRMVLIANEMAIIYTDAGGDPYTGAPGSALMNTENQNSLNLVIMPANYDIGHVFGVGTGGLAAVGGVCAGDRGSASTGRPTPSGDPFDVDFVAHEMGHQFGARHTFNDGTNISCGGTNRNAANAYEPGGGSTVMGYAGICGAGNLQLNSNDYFHVRSLEQIVAFVNGNACDTEIATGNTAPNINAGPNFTIPRSTPFTLTATGNDPNGDALTFCWEEYDLGTASPPEVDDGSRPIFRSFLPVAGTSRTFPRLPFILNNANQPPATYACGSSTCVTGEVLPSTNRTMNFQVTARDNRLGGGGLQSAAMQLTVTTSSGPFVVTQPNTAIIWAINASATVTWDVANTTSAPVSCANVRILLSTDGGNSFPTVLAASTANDGSETITVPNLATTQARVKVEAVGNVFFDISNTNFTIRPEADLSLTKTDAPDPVITGNQITYTILLTNNGPSTASSVTVTDTLPTSTTFVSCQSTNGVCGGTGNNRTVELASLAPGSATITILATANCSLPNGTLVSNTASVSAPTFDPNPGNNSAMTTTTVSNPPPMITCPPNIDTFSDPGQIFATLNPGTPTVTDAGGCPVTITGSRSDGLALNAPYPAGITIITWLATDAAGQTAACLQSVKVRTLADMRAVIDPLVNPASVRQFLTYRIEVINDGPSPALGVTLTDKVDTDVFFISVTVGPGVSSCSYNPATRVVSCELGQINQATAKYALLTVKPQFPGWTTNHATVGVDASLTLDPNTSNNQFTKYTNVIR